MGHLEPAQASDQTTEVKEVRYSQKKERRSVTGRSLHLV